MIPTMILFGLVFGRWWRTALVAAAVVWPAVLLMDGVIAGAPGSKVAVVFQAAALAVANAALGVGVHQIVLAGVRWLRRRFTSD